MINIAIYAPTILELNPVKPYNHPMAGAELSLLHLRDALEQLGNTVICFTNVKEDFPGSSFRSTTEFNEQDFDIVIYSRTYGLKFSNCSTTTRRILWLHDTIEEAASTVAGGIDAIQCALYQYNHLVFVSAWHRLHYSTYFPDLIDWSGKSTSIRHLLPRLQLRRYASSSFDVIHTAHPRKALSAILDIYDRLVSMRPSLRLALVDSAEIYQERNFFYKYETTNLFDILKARYGRKGPPFTVLRAIPQYELIQLLSKCEILLHPDQSTETGATTVLEASMAGCQIIASDLGCLPEMIGSSDFILPAPGIISPSIYAKCVCVALDSRSKRLSCDVGKNIYEHNESQIRRWIDALNQVREKNSKHYVVKKMTSSYRDINEVLALYPSKLTLKLVLEIPEGQTCDIAVHLFSQQKLAIVGLLTPITLPGINEDIDVLSSALMKSMDVLVSHLSACDISHLVMRICCHSVTSTVIGAWLSASSTLGARMLKIRHLAIDCKTRMNNEQRERMNYSSRVLQQIKKAQSVWSIQRMSSNSGYFEIWYNAYNKHRTSFNAVGLERERVRELLNCDDELAVYGALAIDKISGQECGFYVILRNGEFATLFSWGTNQRYSSNLHKLLISDSIRFACQLAVKHFEYGSDLGEYGLHDGLNMLYKSFGGRESHSIQLDISIPCATPTYKPI